MTSCAVATCSNTYQNTKGKQVIFHRFPKENQILSKEWVQRCRRNDKINTKNARVCSEHFDSSEYMDDMQNRLLGLPEKKILKPTAVPNLKLPALNIIRNTPREQRQTKRRRLLEAIERIKCLSPHKLCDTENQCDSDIKCLKCNEYLKNIEELKKRILNAENTVKFLKNEQKRNRTSTTRIIKRLKSNKKLLLNEIQKLKVKIKLLQKGNEMGFECEDPEQKICQLEIEKHQLTLQVNVLSDQVEAQNERIMELEKSLSQNKEQLQNCETLLRKEMSSRSAIESNKLDLMAQISSLRLRLANVENLKRDTEERNHKLENELVLMCACLAEKEADLANFKSKLIHNGIDLPIYDNNSEIEKLKEALSSVMAAYDEKEKKIQEMTTSLNRYKKLHELVLSNSSRKSNEFHLQKLPSVEENIFSALENLTCCDSDKIPELSFNYNLSEKPPLAPRQFLQSSISNEERSQSAMGDISRLSPHFTPIRGESPFSTINSHKYNSLENVHPPTPQKTPPTKRHYSTLPRAHQTDILMKYSKSPPETPAVATGHTSHSFHNLHRASVDASRGKPPSGSSFGKGFLKIRLGKRSCSAPELVPEKLDETGSTPPSNESSYKRTASPLSMNPPKEKSKGFRKIFGKVKRSGSENLNSSAAELKRGGIRATAGPRLGWSEDQKALSCNLKTNIPFAEWDSNMICDWLLTIGLSMYLPNCKKWVKSGDQLLKATTEDFEKALNIKNPLHRKKLLLAINGTKEQTGDVVEPVGKIDHQWVIRWLDDIGLPQYKDTFYDARIDGRMLHHLTLEDLSHLNVTNMLHHISIKTGIQVLRENNFNPHCLKRRSLPEDENTPSDVSKWTNHRVMEWLRNVDLSEYAPNLRGSGVHGGLMLYEPRFNADLMATILNIPPSKTLLRRHLTTQFKQLVGPDIIQKKREWESQPSYLPLSPNAKVKPLKRSPFSLMKRKIKNELDLEDYVCPMNFTEKLLGNSSLLNDQNRTEEEKFLMKEMVLKNETGFESMPASNV